MESKLPKSFGNYLVIILVYLLFFLAARLIFFISFADDGYSTAEIFKSFLTGARLDLSVTAAAVSFIYFIFSVFAVFINGTIIKKIAKVYFGFLSILFLFLVLAEFPFYEEYGLRLNHLFFEYLGNPKELILTINAFFPVALAFVILIVGGALIFLLVSIFFDKIKLFEQESLLGKLISLPLIMVFTVVFIRGGLQWRPINWGAAYHSKHNFINQLTLNGTFNLFHDLQIFLEERQNKIQTKTYFANSRAFEILTEHNKYGSEINLPFKLPVKKPNIVLIFMESFDSSFIGSLNAKKGLTPNFDKLAGQGILFTDAYANGTRTSRGLIAGLCSIHLRRV
jgi:phosphoglycerol transferase MdoB-like AlkP superfamily enzyme